jgi:hypothetical protein
MVMISLMHMIRGGWITMMGKWWSDYFMVKKELLFVPF